MVQKTKKVYKTLEQFKSVTPELLEKIQLKNLSIAELATYDIDDLIETLQQPEAKIKKLVLEAKKNICFAFETLSSVLERRQKVLRLKTGCDNLDTLLGGGAETQSILEVYGESTSGKTHLMHQLAVSATRPTAQGGLDCSVLYLDTEETFRPEKIQSIAQRLQVSEQTILSNILYIRINNSLEQKLVLEKILENPDTIKEYITPPDKPIRVVIIDSIISHLRAEYLGRGMLAERQQLLNSILSNCLKFTRNYNALVLITNQVTNNPDASLFASPIKAAGGAILSHATTFRLYIRKGKDNRRIIKIIDAPNLPQNETVVTLTNFGIED